MSEEILLLSELTILVIERDTALSEIWAILLDAFGALVHIEPTIQGAFRYLQTEIPDCIFCNVSLPGSDGDAFMKGLRQLEVARGIIAIPTIAVVQSVREVNPQVLEAGFQAVIAQPLTLQAIIDTVLQVIGRT